jgi:hypothetical protein
MRTYTVEQIDEIKAQIVEELGLSRVPMNLSPKQTGTILEVTINTLACWRTTGRYNLPYTKLSRRVVYPLNGVAEFVLRRTVNHTGEQA